jgi:hypothetical protein
MDSTYVISTWLFLRALGIIYLSAFISFGVQVTGLIGRKGIVPAEESLQEQRANLGILRFFVLPTLCWWKASDRFLKSLCWGGAALSVLLIAGVASIPVLILLWVFYLSLLNVSNVFLGYQWDALLLETGFLAIWMAPAGLLPEWPPQTEPNRIALWLAWWLLFRLMFSSGMVKLRSGDRTWQTRVALKHHYETQPLPTPLAWFAHQLPEWVHKASCAAMFVIELAVPFLYFMPAPICYVAGLLTIFLMLLIMATGNYCFFNLLTIALCLLVFDDAVWVRVFPWTVTAEPGLAWWTIAPLAVLVLLSIRPMGYLFNRRVGWPALERFLNWLQPCHLVNAYGLFAVMTTTRLEIIIEGSADGRTWKPYEFKWKPGNLTGRLRYCMPHQPRLDWQMWFAALGDLRSWFMNFLVGLLQNSPAVLGLLRTNPFPDAPPRFIRAVLYRYAFTDFATRRSTGALWHRELLGLYCPVLPLKEDKAEAA